MSRLFYPVAGGPEPAGTFSVRSAVLSVLLGAHPEHISSAKLVEAGRDLGLPESGIRVALTRAVAAGDLTRTDDGYGLGERLLARHARQVEAITTRDGAWDQRWELVTIAASGGRGSKDRAALRTLLTEHRLAELREGLWLRPANLTRPRRYAEHPDVLVGAATFDAPEAVIGRLWDLDGWIARGEAAMAEFAAAEEPFARLTRAAQLVQHLSSDPLLPVELRPAGWPAERMRATYAAYQEALRELAGV